MKSTRFSGKISSDPTKKSGRKNPLPYMRKRGLFPPAAPRWGCQGYNPTHPGAKRAAFAAARAARPAAARRVPAPRGPPEKPAPRGPPDLAPFAPVPPRRPAAGERPARAPAPATGPACPPKRAAPFFRRAAAHRAPRLCPGGNRRRAAHRVPAGRPLPAPSGALPPAQGCARRPRGPTGPRRGVPAPARRAAWRVPPRGDQIPGRGLQETAAPSRVNFREIRDPGYRPQNSKQPPQMDGCLLIPQCSGGCL